MNATHAGGGGGDSGAAPAASVVPVVVRLVDQQNHHFNCASVYVTLPGIQVCSKLGSIQTKQHIHNFFQKFLFPHHNYW
ncbi:hypothetical protein T02_588 [Trichinella nativa]|uniref:Uncharacterized protein n=1 Tax=Trichinella nativa TaxID=6335 RepID=A0A0V1L644_9BILA|nr:hypothetical protein T02_588 [Trichinella nativa]